MLTAGDSADFLASIVVLKPSGAVQWNLSFCVSLCWWLLQKLVTNCMYTARAVSRLQYCLKNNSALSGEE